MPYSEPFNATLPSHLEKFNSTRLAGVEWEFESSTNISHIHDWCVKWRGQKKTDHCGWEMMTAPMAGDHIPNCLQELGTAFQKDNTVFSKACGLHVHVNCVDYSWEDIYRLMWVYSRVEDVLFQLGGEWRKKCGWATPIGARYREIVGTRFDPLPPTPPDVYAMSNVVNSMIARYALNLCPWVWAKRYNSPVKTTVEFRIHEYTNDAQRVIGWTQLMVEIVDWAKKATDYRASRLSKNPVRALCRMAPQSRKWILQQLRQKQAHALQPTV